MTQRSETGDPIGPSTFPTRSDAGVPIWFPAPVERKLRYRANIATSVKGQKTFDCTVDAEGFALDEVLGKLDELVAALEKRCPVVVRTRSRK